MCYNKAMPIPLPVRSALAADPFMAVCIHRAFLRDPTPCRGRLEWEHALIHGGRQVQEAFAIVPCCAHEHHRGPGLIKQFNVLIALLRATDEQLKRYSKATDLIHLREFLLTRFAPRAMNLHLIPKAPVCP